MGYQRSLVGIFEMAGKVFWLIKCDGPVAQPGLRALGYEPGDGGSNPLGVSIK